MSTSLGPSKELRADSKMMHMAMANMHEEAIGLKVGKEMQYDGTVLCSNMPSVKWPVGFCKGTVPGAPLVPIPGHLRILKNSSKEMYLVLPEGHILVKNMWSDSQVVQSYRTRGAPFPIHKAPRMPRIIYKKLYLVPGQKARLCQGTFEKPWQPIAHQSRLGLSTPIISTVSH